MGEDVKRVLRRCFRDSRKLEQLFEAAIENTRPPGVCIALGQAVLDLPWPPYHQSRMNWKICSLLSDVQAEPWTSNAAQALVSMCSTEPVDVDQVPTARAREEACCCSTTSSVGRHT